MPHRSPGAHDTVDQVPTPHRIDPRHLAVTGDPVQRFLCVLALASAPHYDVRSPEAMVDVARQACARGTPWWIYDRREGHGHYGYPDHATPANVDRLRLRPSDVRGPLLPTDEVRSAFADPEDYPDAEWLAAIACTFDVPNPTSPLMLEQGVADILAYRARRQAMREDSTWSVADLELDTLRIIIRLPD